TSPREPASGRACAPCPPAALAAPWRSGHHRSMIPIAITTLGISALLSGGLGPLVRERRRRARSVYMAHLESALADGILTEEEAADLESLRAASDLSEREVRMVGLALYRRALRDAAADARVTAEEEAQLRRLQMQLGLSEADLAA